MRQLTALIVLVLTLTACGHEEARQSRRQDNTPTLAAIELASDKAPAACTLDTDCEVAARVSACNSQCEFYAVSSSTLGELHAASVRECGHGIYPARCELPTTTKARCIQGQCRVLVRKQAR